MISRFFPHLTALGYTKTSEATPSYNCIAWAAGDNGRWWWPDPQGQMYWPPSVPRIETVDAFIEAFALFGYSLCNSRDFAHGIQKVALYARHGTPTHAARQLPNGYWTSKLGPNIDIQHTLEGVEGPAYGRVVQILSRSIPP